MLQSEINCFGSTLTPSSKELLEELPMDLEGALHPQCSQGAEMGWMGAHCSALLSGTTAFPGRTDGVKCFLSGAVVQEYEKIPHLKHSAREQGTSDC